MSKSQKKMLAAVGWLGSSGYQTIVYSAAKTGRVQDATAPAERKLAKAPARPRAKV